MATENPRLLFKNTSLNLTGYIYLLTASFVSVPWLVGGLGTERFAEYLLLAALPPILSILDLGMSQAVIRTLSSHTGEKDGVTESTSHTFFLATSVVVGLIAAGLVGLLSKSTVFIQAPLSNLTYAFVIGSVVVNHFLAHFSCVAQSRHRFDIYNQKTWIVGTANTILAGALAVNGYGLEEIFLGLLIAYLITLLMTSYMLDKLRTLIQKPKMNMKKLKELMSYGLRGFGGRAAGQLEVHAGKYIMAATLTASSVSAFTIPQTLIYKSVGVISQGTLALFPLASSLRAPENRTKIRSLYYRLQWYLLIISLVGVVLTIAIGKSFLLWWLGDAVFVGDVFPVLQILSYFFVLMSLTPVASTVVDSLGYPEYTSFSAIATALLNLCFLYVLLPRYGALGGAYAILIASTITTPLFLWVTERVLQSNKIK